MTEIPSNVKQALQETGRDRRNLSPDVFDWSPNSQGQRSRVARLRAETAHKLLGKESDRALELALPAYENLGSTNGTDGDQETFSVSHGIRDCPNTQNVVIWLDGDYYGTPDNDDAVDTGDIDVTDPGSDSTVHVFYVPNKAGTLEIEKAVEGSTSTTKNLKTVSVKNIHRKNLSEQPEYFEFRDGSDPLEPFVARNERPAELHRDAGSRRRARPQGRGHGVDVAPEVDR